MLSRAYKSYLHINILIGIANMLCLFWNLSGSLSKRTTAGTN